MAKMKYWGLFPKKEAAEAFAASFSRAGLGVDIRPERGKWAVYTDREKPAPIVRANKEVFERKPVPKPKREPLAKIALGETANAGTPPKTAFPKGRAENATT
jgi:hypothetical protein